MPSFLCLLLLLKFDRWLCVPRCFLPRSFHLPCFGATQNVSSWDWWFHVFTASYLKTMNEFYMEEDVSTLPIREEKWSSCGSLLVFPRAANEDEPSLGCLRAGNGSRVPSPVPVPVSSGPRGGLSLE